MRLKYSFSFLMLIILLFAGCKTNSDPAISSGFVKPVTESSNQSTSSEPVKPFEPVVIEQEVPPSEPSKSEIPIEPVNPPPVYIEPNADTVLLVLEETTLKLEDIEANPNFFRVSAYVENNSSADLGFLASKYSVDYYNGEAWVEFPFSSENPINWPTGGGYLYPGEKTTLTFFAWEFERELLPGRYRFVWNEYENFIVCAEFEIV